MKKCDILYRYNTKNGKKRSMRDYYNIRIYINTDNIYGTYY